MRDANQKIRSDVANINQSYLGNNPSMNLNTPTQNATSMQSPGPPQTSNNTTVQANPPASGTLSDTTTNPQQNTASNQYSTAGYPVSIAVKNGKTVLVDKDGNQVSKQSQFLLRHFQSQAKKKQQLAKFNWEQKKYIYNVSKDIKNIDEDEYKNLKKIQQLNPQSFQQFKKLKNMSNEDRNRYKNKDNQNEWYQAFANKDANRDQLLNQMVVASYNNERKNNTKKLSQQVLYEYSKQRPPQYLIGQFASFARQKQQQILQKQKLIKWIIRQAVISYQKKLKQNYQALKQISNSSTSEEELLLYFNNMEDVKKFIDNQIQFTTQQVKQTDFFSIYKILKVFIARKKLIRKTAFVDGKFLKLAELKISQRFYHQKIIYIPTNNDNIYLRFSPKQAPVRVLFRQNQFFSQKQLQVLDEAAKNQIIQMVMLYLREKKIILSKIQAQTIQKKIISQIKSSTK